MINLKSILNKITEDDKLRYKIINIETIFQEHLSIFILDLLESLNYFLFKTNEKLKFKEIDKYKNTIKEILKQDISDKTYFNKEEMEIIQLFENNIKVKFDNTEILIPINFLKYIANSENFIKLLNAQINLKIFILCIFKIYFKNFIASFKNNNIIIIIISIFCNMFYAENSKFMFQLEKYEKKIIIEKVKLININLIYSNYTSYINICSKNSHEINYLIADFCINEFKDLI